MSPIMKPCLDCRQWIPQGRANRCPACQKAKDALRRRMRNPVALSVYQSARWRALAAAVTREATHCYWCTTPAALTKLTADHILSIRSRPDLALDEGNIVPSCRSCQERRKRQPDPSEWPSWARKPRTW